MELLTITHQDFTMTIECSKFGGIWGKAKRNVGEENLTSNYAWSDGVLSVVKFTDDGSEIPIVQGEPVPAIFFDNADYSIWVEFNDGISNAKFCTKLQSDSENFSFHKKRRILSGFINYGNDIGRSEISIIYVMNGELCKFVFCFDVLSSKLNYHDHWRSIIEDIEAEYSMLSLDYMRRTFHGFTPDTKGERADLVWWSIFEGLQQKFIKAVRNIIDRPRQRLNGVSAYLRADKLRRIPKHIENQLAEHRNEKSHLYWVEEQIHSNDTQENRFLKHALVEVSKKYESLKKRIESMKNVSVSFKADMDSTLRILKNLQRNPFFRSVGYFKGFTQESLVLQRATGYADVYCTWSLLRRAYSLNDGMYRLQSKDIATLYEIWCFIEVSHIVKSQLNIDDADVEHRNRMEMNGTFTLELGKGENSRILFRKNGVELAELVYNPKHTDKENDNISIANIVVPTVAQKPDIVLRLVKNDVQKNMKMTYLFDAKYRIDGNVNGVDTPPEDAINQMHRYRDAIYYKANANAELKKEVIGGYILFPGSGEPLDVQAASFYKSIKEVNIGAFPLRPKDKENRTLLCDFIHSLINDKGQELIEDAIPQKGLNYIIDGVGTDSDMTFVGYVHKPEDGDSQAYQDYYNSFLNNDSPKLYYSGKQLQNDIDLRSVKYVFTNVPGNGYYRVKRIFSALRQDLIEDKTEKDPSMRICFELGDFISLGAKKIQFNISSEGEGLHVPSEGKFISLKLVKDLYNEISESPLKI